MRNPFDSAPVMKNQTEAVLSDDVSVSPILMFLFKPCAYSEFCPKAPEGISPQNAQNGVELLTKH
jgi:hypothetical protein